jgi:aminomethyltransferase
MDLKTTPLTDEHKGLGAKLAPFGGWLMPIQYAGIIAEHQWTRTHVSVFDICHMGEFFVSGDARKSGLSNIVTFDLESLAIGACRYGFMLSEAGGIIDDLIVYRIAPAEWMVVVNAATIDGDAGHFRKHLAGAATFRNASNETGKLDLQGPESLDVMKKLVGPRIADLRYYTFGHFDLLGEKIIISRTGYTGELGYELYISSSKVKDLWRLLLDDKRVNPAGLGARDTLRLEMGYPLYGHDLTSDTTPMEGGKEKFVDLKKDFIGKAALLAGKRPYKKLIYFTAHSRRAPRYHYKIALKQKEIGIVTSGSFAPSLSCGIGMGYVNTPCPVGTEIVLKENDVEIPAVVTTAPFYKSGGAKISEDSHAHT